MVSFPYNSHTTPIRIPKDMGIVWEAYHKGVPLLGVPENPIDRIHGNSNIHPATSQSYPPPEIMLEYRIMTMNHHCPLYNKIF